MYRKLFIIRLVLILMIPLSPLGALLFLSKTRDRRIIPDSPPNIREEQMSQLEAAPAAGTIGRPSSPEQLARVFRPPINNKWRQIQVPGTQAGERPVPTDGNTRPAPIPGDEKFSYLGFIREINDQEWLYLKEKETGKIISIKASLVSANEENCVVDIGGIHYFIRRN